MTIWSGNTIYLHGICGDPHDGRQGFVTGEVVDALRNIGAARPVVVSINSEGGFFEDGVAIYQALKSHPSRVTCVVEGIALSAGSLIAMAGDEIIMRLGSLMMIHGCSGSYHGTVQQIENGLEMSRRINRAMAEIYSLRTKTPRADIDRMLAKDTWFTAEEAVAARFADHVDTDFAQISASFDINRFKGAPAKAQDAIRVAKARAPNLLVATMRKQTGLPPVKAAGRPVNQSPSEGLLVSLMRKQTASRDR